MVPTSSQKNFISSFMRHVVSHSSTWSARGTLGLGVGRHLQILASAPGLIHVLVLRKRSLFQKMGDAQSSLDAIDLWAAGCHDKPAAVKRPCRVCKAPKEQHDFPSKRQFKAHGHCTACTCSYCGRSGDMTKEHLLPRSVGGTTIIAACLTCNRDRGRSGRYPPFRRYIATHPHTWASAVFSSTRDPAEVSKYLSDEDLHSITFLALRRAGAIKTGVLLEYDGVHVSAAGRCGGV